MDLPAKSIRNNELTQFHKKSKDIFEKRNSCQNYYQCHQPRNVFIQFQRIIFMI